MANSIKKNALENIEKCTNKNDILTEVRLFKIVSNNNKCAELVNFAV